MNIMKVIQGRRSIRKFKTLEVDSKRVRQLIEAVRMAPSWGNRQCWEFIMVRDRGLKTQLAGCLKSPITGGHNKSQLAVLNAPIVVVACARRGVSGYYQTGEHAGAPATDKGDYWFMFDVGIAMQNLALAAYGIGLGTVHVGLFDAGQVARLLEVPGDIAVVALMPLGFPDEDPKPPRRKEPSEFVYEDTYGQPLRT